MEIKIAGHVFTPQRVFCVGRNYAAHARELQNDIPDEPVIFCKPATALVFPEHKTIPFPGFGKNLHYETELVVLIGREGQPDNETDAVNYIAGLTTGFDLTMRDVQDKLREQGLPWEKSKAFDFSAPVGKFHKFDRNTDLNNITFSGSVNGVVRQRGNTGNMLFSIPRLLTELGKYWKLLPGDVLFTGTPEGVDALHSGDEIEAVAPCGNAFSWKID